MTTVDVKGIALGMESFGDDDAQILGDDPVAARAVAARVWDRTPGTASEVQMANQTLRRTHQGSGVRNTRGRAVALAPGEIDKVSGTPARLLDAVSIVRL
ncbi:hypothetical protein [Streptomyces sp. NPDC007984]|uniref:hypothetical protein n=1 Tax=Streptomyces sp. NPDC007984 TaxID=3364801 RepID=UPI0036E42836